MTTRRYCDGCDAQLGALAGRPNWWHATFEGDVTRDMDGRILEDTGMDHANGGGHYRMRLDTVDLCIPCMTKTQRKDTT